MPGRSPPRDRKRESAILEGPVTAPVLQKWNRICIGESQRRGEGHERIVNCPDGFAVKICKAMEEQTCIEASLLLAKK